MIKKFNEYSINESVSTALLVAYMIMFIKWRNLTPEKMTHNIKSWLVDFCLFISKYGYAIDKDSLEYKFQGLIDEAFQKIDAAGDYVYSKFNKRDLK
jgi:hypothetical protein